MTPERKAEINRRLAEFYEKATDYHAIAITVDFTESLDALARLETKLPPHRWMLMRRLDGANAATLVWANEQFLDGYGTTEAEARAEAICHHLELE